MAGDSRYSGPYHKKGAETLDALVDFGPDTTPTPTFLSGPASPDVTSRLRRLVEQMQEISKRIDHLTERD